MSPHDRLRSPQHRANLRAWATFRRACGNELVVDAELMRWLGLSELLPDVIPRPISVSRKLSRVKPLWPLLFRLAAGLWPWLLFPALLALQIVRTWGQTRRTVRRTTSMSSDVAVVLTARICDVIRCVPAERRPRQWITTPWQTASVTAEDGEAVSLLSYLRSGDLQRTAWLCWMAMRIVRCKGLGHFPGGQCRTAILQTYIAWDWFLTWQLLPRAVTPSSGLWFANHYDRWAVLLDRLPAGGPRHLVQHGFARGELRMPYRQRRVGEVLYFDQGTRRILQDVALRPTCRPRWTPLQAQLRLTPLDDPALELGRERFNGVVLIIGQPQKPELERDLLSRLLAELPEVVLLYKAHPLYGRSGAAHVPSPVRVLLGRSLFPAADVVLSGESWLGVEYESTGTPVLWYKSRPLAEVPQAVRTLLKQAAGRARAA